MKVKIFAIMLMAAIFCSAFVDDPGTPRWHGNNHFKISQREQVVSVLMSKLPWESFSVDLEDLKVQEGLLSFEVKSTEAFLLRADGFTNDQSQIELFNETIEANQFQEVSYSFANHQAGVSHIIFYVNPGKIFHGNIEFRNIRAVAGSELGQVQSFPNPSPGQFTVELPDAQYKQISVVDASGKTILLQRPTGTRTKIDITQQPAGVYILKARSNSALLTTKLVVEK